MNKLLEDAMPIVATKTRASKQLSDVSKQIKEITHYELEDISLYKDIVHYKGLGWTDTPLTKPDAQVRFKDRVSPCFRRLSEVIRVAKMFGNLEILEEYFKAMKDLGIEIIVHDIPDKTDVYNDTKELVNQLDIIQGKVCHNANLLRDMGIRAEEEQFCPKSKFKELAESKYRLLDKPQVADGLKDTLAENLLHNHGIQEVLEDDNEDFN